MLLAHKIKLKPNNHQVTYFARAAGVARFTYNWALNRWKEQYEAGEKPSEKPSEAMLRKQLNAIKAREFPWMGEVTKTAPQQAIKDLGAAFQHFFRRVNNGEKPGYPRCKKKGRHDNFRADNGPPVRGADALRVEGKRVKLPKLGWVRMTEQVRFTGQIKSVTVSRQADGWYAAFLVDTEVLPHASRKNHGGAVGIDLGVARLAVTSDDQRFAGPKPHRALLCRLRRLNRSLSRKENGSSNQQRAKRRLARLHKRIADIREDALHKFTTEIVLNYDLIGIEDLNVGGMVGNRHLARAIMDQSFGALRNMFEYKAAWYDASVVVVDRFFPSTKMCSACGQIRDMPLSRREMACDCGLVMDRDLNAAINLRNLAM
ncbi:transposase, partial [Candidatus Bipolaricaulota bacterium]|nr:transposase [Candidatus Bipolaricaulota bacterium]